MSFIYGIIDLKGSAVNAADINALASGVKWEHFIEQSNVQGSIAVGYCSHPERKPKAGIFRNDDIILVADIRIYNNDELKKFFDYTSPEAGFVKAYQRWGMECANHINGDFAVVLIDRRKNEVHLFRDHIGARPLVYHFSSNRLIFASHEFGIAKSGLLNVSLSEEKLVNSLFRFTRSYSQSDFQDIYKVVPGHSVSISQDQVRSVKYWKPEEINKDRTLSFETAVSCLREKIRTATLSRMEEGKIGAHVSGGLDSCGVASILADHVSGKLRLTGYSWTPEVFEDEVEGVNEKEYIDAFSEDKGIEVKYLQNEEFETVKDAILPEFETQYIEHPTMKMAGKDGIEFLFSGWGGDEFVSLSTRGTVNHLFFSFKWLTLMKYVRKVGIRSTIYQFRTDVFPFLIPFGLLPIYSSQYIDWSKLGLLKPAFIRKHWKLLIFHKRKGIFSYGNRSRFMLNLLELYHLPNRMDSWGINAERHGFEYKYPLLDKDVLELWFSIPVEYTYKDFHPRLLYREAMKGILTEKIRTRKDKGEAVRIANSFKELLDGEKYLEHLYYSLSEKDHLPYFKPDAFTKVINGPMSKEPIKSWREKGKLTFYLRYVALAKKYLTPIHNLTNTL